MTVVRVPFDPEVQPIVEEWAANPSITLDFVRSTRGLAEPGPSDLEIVGERDIDVVDRVVPGPAGAPDIALTVFTPRGAPGTRPALYNIHGGGMMIGSRHMDTPRLAELVDELGVVAINVDYRLAPENPYPAAVDDCYSGLLWTVEHAAELGIDPERLVVMGGSAGGGLAAAMALKARNENGPALAGQLLLCPMLDDRMITPSSTQYQGVGTWTREANVVGWAALLGEHYDANDVPDYAAPGRADDLSGLPSAFIEAGAAELFRDEDVAYASRIWATGGQCELHIWAGGCHGFDMFVPDSAVAGAARAARSSWLRRTLGLALA